MCEIRLSAEVFPTEERGRIEAAILTLFPDAVIEGEGTITACSTSIDAFAEQLAKQRIRAAARKILLRGLEGSETRFRLNKQVATTGKVSFSEEDHPLGDIKVVVRSRDIHGLIDSLAPSLKEDLR